jgi:Zn-dependent protease
MGALMVGIINLIIGSFNMIPVMPLDGSKIWKWNKAIYLIMLVFLLGPVIAFFMFQSMIL